MEASEIVNRFNRVDHPALIQAFHLVNNLYQLVTTLRSNYSLREKQPFTAPFVAVIIEVYRMKLVVDDLVLWDSCKDSITDLRINNCIDKIKARWPELYS